MIQVHWHYRRLVKTHLGIGTGEVKLPYWQVIDSTQEKKTKLYQKAIRTDK